MDTRIGQKFELPSSYRNNFIYEIVGETENKDFWIIRNTSYPKYDDRGKERWYSKWEIEEKIENKYFNKL